MEPLPKCPYAPKKARGAHDLSAVIPDTVDNPMTLFCSRCGMALRHSLSLPLPMDDLPSDAIARMAKR
jgi:hypothetical protein